MEIEIDVEIEIIVLQNQTWRVAGDRGLTLI